MKKICCAIAVLLAASCMKTPPTHEASSSTAARPVQHVSMEERAALDRVPNGYVENFARFRTQRTGTLAIYEPQYAWNKALVTVAFNGGDEATYALIEEAAQEWTANSDRHFTLQFRDAQNRFLHWSATDRQPVADIRVGFVPVNGRSSYWSEIGIVATSKPPGIQTMNFGHLPEDIAADVGTGSNQYEWKDSYEHETVLHEFGHALGLYHEQYHPDCQADIKFDPDPGYVDTFAPNDHDHLWRIPNGNLSPGAIRYFSSPGFGWSEQDARLAVDAHAYFGADFPKVQMTPHIDTDSVMLYYLDDFLLKSGTHSPCLSGYGWPTHLSPTDIAYFRRYYAVPFPRPLIPRQPDR